MREILGLFLATAILASPAEAQEPQGGEARVEGRFERDPSVGMRARIDDLVLPGSQLQARPAVVDAPIVVRVLAARVHGTAFRYDLEYYGLDPGPFDVTDYLSRVDGSSTADLPPLIVNIQPLLPPGQVEPHPVLPVATPEVGGYATWLKVGVIAWVIGFLAIVMVGRRRRRLEAEQAGPALTLADRLRPLVEAAQRGELDEPAKAELERVLLHYWRRRLGLAEEKAGRAMIQLRDHDEAGPLLRQVERWLHHPEPGGDADIAALLEPYRDTPADFDRVEAS